MKRSRSRMRPSWSATFECPGRKGHAQGPGRAGRCEGRRGRRREGRGLAASNLGFPFTVTTDAKGRFQAERSLDPLVICAKSPDGTLGAIVEIGAEDPQVTIALSPTAMATGVLLDEQGKPAANQKLYWGRRVYQEEEQRVSMICFAPKVVTDGEGKFTLPSLVVGQKYEIAVARENRLPRGRHCAAREGRHV